MIYNHGNFKKLQDENEALKALVTAQKPTQPIAPVPEPKPVPEIKEPEIKEPEIKEPEIKEPEIKEPEVLRARNEDGTFMADDPDTEENEAFEEVIPTV